MSYGWILSTTDGTRLVKCIGPGYGSSPTPFRAEAYGVLSILLFLRLIAETAGVPTLSGLVVCDCKSLVKRIPDDPLFCTNNALASEWDIFQLIHQFSTCIHRRIEWVKGHGGEKRSYDSLPFKQQLNVDAHYLADEYQPDALVDYS